MGEPEEGFILYSGLINPAYTMTSPADRLVQATMEYTLRPKSGDRERLIAAVLNFIVKEYGDSISSQDLAELVEGLTV